MEKIFHTDNPPFFSFLTLFLFTVLLLPASTHAKSDKSVTIDNGDLLYVVIPREVTGEFSPTERNYFKEKVEVDRHGFIFLPTQGNIKIAGLTTQQISELLTNNLPKYLSKSDRASVNLIEKRHYIQILGHVTTPGWYNIPESANIQAILSQAGGALEGADLSKVSISRIKNGKPLKILANIQKYLLKGNTSILPPLHQDDTVFVPLEVTVNNLTGTRSNSNTAKIRIFGAVNRPGSYPVSDKGINFLDLLITAQGETADADLANIKIMHADGTRESFNMQALLDSTESNQNNSFPLIKNGDIIHIARRPPMRTGMINGQTTQINAPQTITMSGPGSNGRGLQAFTEPMTPLQAIAQAGGVNDFADTNDIIIIRRVDGKQVNLPYDYDKALDGEEPDVDFQLQAGDMIYIP